MGEQVVEMIGKWILMKRLVWNTKRLVWNMRFYKKIGVEYYAYPHARVR